MTRLLAEPCTHTMLFGRRRRHVCQSFSKHSSKSLALLSHLSLSLPASLSPHDCPSIQRTVNNQILSVQVTMCCAVHPPILAHPYTHSLIPSFSPMHERERNFCPFNNNLFRFVGMARLWDHGMAIQLLSCAGRKGTPLQIALSSRAQHITRAGSGWGRVSDF